MSRRFVAATETALAELLAADLSGLDLVALMIDGVHFGEHTCVVALGIDIDGTKHPLSLVEGSTENATLVTELIVGLRERGLDVTRPILVGARRVEGAAPGGARRVRPPGDRPLPTPQDPKRAGPAAGQAALGRGGPDARAYHAESALAAEAELTALAAELDKTHPGAAASLREGMAETLTVLRLGVPPTLARTLRSTNAVESMIRICRTPRPQRQALARRADGAALVRRRHGRGRQAVPPGQRPPTPTIPARHAGKGHRTRRCHRS